MNAPMDLESALARVRGLLPALEKLLAPDAMLAFRTVYDAADGSALAKVVAETNRATARALSVEAVHHATHAVKVPHLFLGNSGRPCCLCFRHKPDPIHQLPAVDIHPNRGTP